MILVVAFFMSEQKRKNKITHEKKAPLNLGAFKILLRDQLPLTRLVTWVLFIDHVNTPLTTHCLTSTATLLQAF